MRKEIASLKIPPASLSWSEFAKFGYHVTDQILTSTAAELKSPPAKLRSMLATRAVAEVARCADEIAPADESSPVEVLVDYLALTGPDKTGLLDVSASAVRRGKVEKRFQLRYRLAFGRQTMEPILEDFAMLGSHNRLARRSRE